MSSRKKFFLLLLTMFIMLKLSCYSSRKDTNPMNNIITQTFCTPNSDYILWAVKICWFSNIHRLWVQEEGSITIPFLILQPITKHLILQPMHIISTVIMEDGLYTTLVSSFLLVYALRGLHFCPTNSEFKFSDGLIHQNHLQLTSAEVLTISFVLDGIVIILDWRHSV